MPQHEWLEKKEKWARRGWMLGKARTLKSLVGLVWTVDALRPETSDFFVTEAPTLEEALDNIERMILEADPDVEEDAALPASGPDSNG